MWAHCLQERTSHEDNLGSLWEPLFRLPTVEFHLFTFKADVFIVCSAHSLTPRPPEGVGLVPLLVPILQLRKLRLREQSEPRSARPRRTCHRSSHPGRERPWRTQLTETLRSLLRAEAISTLKGVPWASRGQCSLVGHPGADPGRLGTPDRHPRLFWRQFQ